MPTLVDELKRLRRGRGVLSPGIEVLAGPGLRMLCGITELDGPAAGRQKLTKRLGELATRLPDDLGLALLAALAIHPEARHPLLKDRMSWLAGCIGKDDRTARRRADDACALLAESAADERPDDGWYVASFDALVRRYQRPIYWLALRPGHDVGVSVLYGGRLSRRERPSESHFRFAITLPSVLRAGQPHEYGIELRVPPGQPMRPHYVFVPLRRCDRFELRIRFDPTRLPGSIWVVTGAPMRVVDDAQPSGEPLRVDAAGEIRHEFHDLTQGLGYGVQWR